MSAVLAFLLSPVGRWIATASAILAVLGLAWAYVHHVEARIAELSQKAASEHASATVAQGQTQAQQAASAIVDQGRAKADVTVHIQQENERAILAAPGASQAVDPGLYGALVGSLCKYPSYSAGPQCAAMRAADPGQLPPANPAGSDTEPHDWGYSRSARPSNGPA